MTVLREVIDVKAAPAEAFDSVTDFSSSASWDPGVASAERVREGRDSPSGVGAEYRLIVTFRGRAAEMTYTTTEYERPERVVLEGEGPNIAATDTIEFEASIAGGTRIAYVADLRLTGLAKVAQPFLAGAFNTMGKRAIAGMRTWLDERAR